MGNLLQRQFVWTDRRPICALHICDGALVHTSSTNPASWLFDPSVDITTQNGLANFASRVDTWADWCIQSMQYINAQGGIVWEFDGGRYPSEMYLGAPDLASKLNPELDYGAPNSIIRNAFAKFRAAGFKVGVTIRPCEFNLTTHVNETSADYFSTLFRKATFAHEQWGCTLIYIDTNLTQANGGALLPATIFARLHKALPNCLLIPEAESREYYLWTAPYLALENGDTGTPADVRADIADAFGVIEVNSGDITANAAALKASVKRGDILLVNGYNDPAQLSNPALRLTNVIAAYS